MELLPDQKEIARLLWNDLENGVKGAPERLSRVSSLTRDAILSELVIAMDTRGITLNPFN